MTTDKPSQHEERAASEDVIDAELGRQLHVYEVQAKVKSKDRTRRQLEILGVLAVLIIPISLMYVKGTTGTVMAIFGGVVAVMAYFLSARKPAVRSTTIRVFERGVACAEGEAERRVRWNEVLEVKTKRFPLPDGRSSVAIALEVVGAPPLLFVVTGTFTERDRAGKLIEALTRVWIPVWCRRARMLLEAGRDVEVGRARLSGDALMIEERSLSWADIRGVESDEGAEKLVTAEGPTTVEADGLVRPFPSTARRLVALSEAPPSRPLLPAARK